jgi:antitoxin VapB
MPLNIKSAKAYELAQRVARATGESLTEAVTVALEERLTRVDARFDGLADDILAIGRDCAARLEEPWRSLDHAELLYDDKGLPR